jgi:1,4-dihydroxy-2-naphthoyl-CoA hydrolase
MTFTYWRTVYLNDTDAAGVVYFASGMQICHEAYEESLRAANIYLLEMIDRREIALPIARAEIDFLRPLLLGDRLKIELTTEQLTASEFTIAYEIYTAANPDKIAIKASTKHVGINPQTRKRIPLPEVLRQWLDSNHINCQK